MRRRLAPLLLALAGAAPALAGTAPAGAATRAQALAPVIVHDSGERSPLTSVEAARVPGVPTGTPEPTVYARRAGQWLQYWLYFAANTQDRGILHTGRHAGDWELVQYRLRGGRPVQAVYAQHAGGESCPMGAVRTRRGHPLVFLAQGSHAAYFVPGLRDRIWPDPNDRADGDGPRVRPRVVRIAEDEPAWMRFRGRWGGARASWVPGEMDSPRGPAFQPDGRWSDPDAWAAGARRCTRTRCDQRGECDGPETGMAGAAAGAGLLAALLWTRRRVRPRPAGR